MAQHSRGRLFSTRGKGAGNALLRRIVILAAASVAIITIALVAGYYQLLSYLQGDSFRKTISDTLRSISGARQVEVAGNLNIQGNRVSNEGISLTGMRQVEQAKATGISAEVNRSALLGRKLHLYKLTMEEASISISMDENTVAGLPSLPASAKNTGKKKKNSNRKKRTTNSSNDGIAAPSHIQSTAAMTTRTGIENSDQKAIIRFLFFLGVRDIFFAIIVIFTYKLTKITTKFGKLPCL